MLKAFSSSHCQRGTWVALAGALCTALPALAGDTPGGDLFGEAIALSGDTVVIGRPSTQPASSTREGAALVFIRQEGSWQFQAELAGDITTSGDGFGAAVALSGNTMAIAAPYASPPAVYVFERQGTRWVRNARIDAPQSNVGFARAVALHADTLLIGAQFRNGSRGATYVFERLGKDWQIAATLAANDGDPDDRFGNAVAIDGSRAVIGAYGHGFGAAYIFDRIGGSWQQSERIEAEDGRLGDRFGLAVAVRGERVVVGAPGTEADDFEEQGAAIVFERDATGWAQTAELSAFDGRENDLFGWSLSLDDNTLVAGAIFDSDTVDIQGSAYAFTHVGGTWISSMKLRASNARVGDIFGNAVALDGDLLWVGAPGFQNNGFGTAYAFERVGLLWDTGERFVDPSLFADQFEGN